MPASDAIPTAPVAPAAYCRRCGYSLRGLPTGTCPECGGAFDLADRRTFAPRPPRSRLRRWVWRVSILTVILTLAAASVPGWYWWQWRAEQKVIAELRGTGAQVEVRRIKPQGLAKYLPARWAFLHDHGHLVQALSLTADQLHRLDLGALAHMQELRLYRCDVTEATLARLGGLAELETLDLTDCPWDGSGLGHLAACRKLRFLNLGGTGIHDYGLRDVGRLTSLTWLGLDNTRVTDAGMDQLAGLRSLRRLSLSDTTVTDAGLLRLRGLSTLLQVWIGDTKVTEQGERDLRTFLPNVEIHR